MPNHKRVPAKNNQNFFYVFKKHPVLVSICCIVLVAIISTFIYRYYEQQKTLNDLSVASKDLRVIYDNLLASQGGNVSSSNFRNECSESSVEVGGGRIACGPSGYINLQSGVAVDDAIKALNSIASANNLKSLIETGETSTSAQEIYTKFRYPSMKIDCVVNHATSSTYYMTCRESVPDFLPGYIVTD